jgi:hypothetical protein
VSARCAARFTLRSARKSKNPAAKEFFLPRQPSRNAFESKDVAPLVTLARSAPVIYRVGITHHLWSNGGQCPPKGSLKTEYLFIARGAAQQSATGRNNLFHPPFSRLKPP